MKPKVRAHTRSRCWVIFFLTMFAGLLLASEETATERAMESILAKKSEGFVNVKGERRGYMAKGGILKQRIKLFGKQDYLVIVSGDEEVKNIKMKIMDKKGKKLLMESDGAGSTAVLKFTPAQKNKYTFLIECPGAQGYYHFSLVTK